jgi:hypothetical protein
MNLLSATTYCCAHHILRLSYNHNKKRGYFPLIDHNRENISTKKRLKEVISIVTFVLNKSK